MGFNEKKAFLGLFLSTTLRPMMKRSKVLVIDAFVGLHSGTADYVATKEKRWTFCHHCLPSEATTKLQMKTVLRRRFLFVQFLFELFNEILLAAGGDNWRQCKKGENITTKEKKNSVANMSRSLELKNLEDTREKYLKKSQTIQFLLDFFPRFATVPRSTMSTRKRKYESVNRGYLN